MKRIVSAVTLCCAALLLYPTSALAQTAPASQCGKRQTVVDHLAAKFGETRHGIGMSANNTVMEVFASDKTGTWTITVTLPTGVTCLVASGEGFEAMAEALPASGDDV